MRRVLLLAAVFTMVSVSLAQEKTDKDQIPAGIQRPSVPPAAQIGTITKLKSDDIPFGGTLMVQFSGSQPGTSLSLVVHTGKESKVYFFEPFKEATVADLKIGTRIYFKPGRVAKSKPAQAYPDTMFIMERSEPDKNK